MAAIRESTKDRVAAVEPVVRRVLASKVYDPNRLDDLVQETLTRLASSRRDLDGEALVAYAIVSARNLFASDSARSSRRGALQHRLADTRQPEQPEVTVMAGERRTALRTALDSLSEAERSAVLAHEVEGVDTATIAADQRSTPGAVAARLARARAKLRVDYLVAYRRAHLPTKDCHSVLVSLSAGDQRRQSSLGAGDHVLACPSCAELAPTLVERRLPLSVLIPAGALGPALRAAGKKSGSHAAQATAAVGTAGVVAAAVIVMNREPERPLTAVAPPPTCPGLVTTGGQPAGPESLGGTPGTGVEGRAMTVQSVPANEGFWIACGQARVWLRLVGAGESPRATWPGATVDFRASSARHGPGFAAGQGVDPAEGAAELDAQGVHLEAAYSDLKP